MTQHLPPAAPPSPAGPGPFAGPPPAQDGETLRFRPAPYADGAPSAGGTPSPAGVPYPGWIPVGPRRGRRRALLVGGAVVAVLLVAAVTWLALPASGSAHRIGAAAASAPLPSSGAPGALQAPTTGGTPSALPPAGAQGVLDACRTILPALMGFQADVSDADSADSVLAKLTALQRSIAAAGAGAGDPAFASHAQRLSDDFGRFGDAVRSGADPTALQTVLEQDGTAVGTDCGLAGWRP